MDEKKITDWFQFEAEEDFDFLAGACRPTEKILDWGRLQEKIRCQFLKSCRRSAAVKIEALSKKTGIPTQEIKRIETGKVEAKDARLLHKLANFYGLDYQKLMMVYGLVQPKPDMETALPVAAYHKGKPLSEEIQKKLDKIVKLLAKEIGKGK